MIMDIINFNNFIENFIENALYFERYDFSNFPNFLRFFLPLNLFKARVFKYGALLGMTNMASHSHVATLSSAISATGHTHGVF